MNSNITPPGPRVTVFVGNLSYDTTEEQLMEVLREVGPVKSFKLNFDRQTQKPKGFGFAEYYDLETASSAVRNLNGRDFMKRQLKVSYAKADPKGGFAGADNRSVTGGSGAGGAGVGSSGNKSVYGSSTPMNNAADHVVAAVAGMSDTFLFDVVRQMKGYIEERPEDARRLLEQNPQVAFALVHMQIKMGVVDEAKARALLNPEAERRIQQSQQQQHSRPPQHPHQSQHSQHQQHSQRPHGQNIPHNQHQMMHGMPPKQHFMGGRGMEARHGPVHGNAPFGNHMDRMHPGMGGRMPGGGGVDGMGNGNGNVGGPPPNAVGGMRGPPMGGMQAPAGNDQARKMEIYEKVRNMTEDDIRNGPYEEATRTKLLKIKRALQTT